MNGPNALFQDGKTSKSLFNLDVQELAQTKEDVVGAGLDKVRPICKTLADEVRLRVKGYIEGKFSCDMAASETS